ncbi:MAG: hypothetical protein ACLRM9_04170 [Collinsella aerofaciens]
MGPNGAGKSTLGHVVMGDPVYTVNDGRIVFDGQDITGAHHRQAFARRPVPELPGSGRDPGVPLSSFCAPASPAAPAGDEGQGVPPSRRASSRPSSTWIPPTSTASWAWASRAARRRRSRCSSSCCCSPSSPSSTRPTRAWTSTRFPPSATAWTPTARAATAPCSLSRTTRASRSTWMSTASTLWSRVTSCARTTPRSSLDRQERL